MSSDDATGIRDRLCRDIKLGLERATGREPKVERGAGTAPSFVRAFFDHGGDRQHQVVVSVDERGDASLHVTATYAASPGKSPIDRPMGEGADAAHFPASTPDLASVVVREALGRLQGP